MPDARDLTLFQWGEEPRRHRLARQASLLRAAAVAGVAVVLTALVTTLLWPPRPLLDWNASASSPLGLYLVAAPADVEPGDMVIAWPPVGARRLGAERHYLPSNVPLVKRVAAIGGDRVCAAGASIFVNGRIEATRRARDGAGQPMPWWNGCEELRGEDLFLLVPNEPSSFDGRYFGITRAPETIGSATLIWAR